MTTLDSFDNIKYKENKRHVAQKQPEEKEILNKTALPVSESVEFNENIIYQNKEDSDKN